jgi:MFS family permease
LDKEIPMAWTSNVRVRLSVMMFLQYAFQGIWVIPMANYLTKTVGFSDGQVAWMGSTIALGFILAPFFVGMIADRFLAAQKVLGVLNILAAVMRERRAIRTCGRCSSCCWRTTCSTRRRGP